MSLKINIRKAFPDFVLNVELDADDGVLALLGGSGCGKSLTLKCIAGIEKPDSGRIVINGQVVFDSDKNINIPPQGRNVGFLFQNYALFPTMTVLGNIASVVEGKKLHRLAVAGEIADKFGLESVKNLYPREISGGQQQRTALARILVRKPQILMLDEPFSALDTHLRWHMEQEMAVVLADFSGVTLVVTHDRDEAYRMSGKIAVMNEGRLDCIGDKDDIFTNPKTLEAARMTGCKNISKAEKTGDYAVYAVDWGITLKTVKPVTDRVKHIGVRSHHFQPGLGENSFPITVHGSINEPFSRIWLFAFNENAEKLQFATKCEGCAPNALSVPPDKILLLE
ncbi:MAG: ATP-binding cassette domain-containing protein [Defluviitaleaceae bacterium]|nr:ATP-binding cassette domain-containing protein [Defluviitaleaceae bacterium]